MRLFLLLFLVSCGKPIKYVEEYQQNASIFNIFTPIDKPLRYLPYLDFRRYFFEAQLDTGLDELCNGQYQFTHDVFGAEPSKTTIVGEYDLGIIQNGHTKNVLSTINTQQCANVSGEAYTYEIHGDILLLCSVHFPECALYKVVK